MSESTRYEETECIALFDRMFPHAFAGDDVLTEIAPNGWHRSPLLAVFHPSVQQVYRERLQAHENLCSLRRRDDDRPVPPPPTLEEVASEFSESPVDVEREVQELVGMCLWDVFSDNHEVVSADCRLVDLGSFRACGAFIAEYLNQRIGRRQYDYLSFYMGTVWVSQRADLTPVYEMIFRRLRVCQLDWLYHFPRLYLVDLRPLQAALDDGDGEPEWAHYEPSEAFVRDQEDKERKREIAEMRASLDKAYREAAAAARQHPPPKTVAAYQAVYGQFPRGWPPTCDTETAQE